MISAYELSNTPKTSKARSLKTTFTKLHKVTQLLNHHPVKTLLKLKQANSTIYNGTWWPDERDVRFDSKIRTDKIHIFVWAVITATHPNTVEHHRLCEDL